MKGLEPEDVSDARTQPELNGRPRPNGLFAPVARNPPACPCRHGQKPPNTLHVLDEPTKGLHMADVERPTAVLHRLLAGGTVVCAGTPEALVAQGTHTRRALAPVLARR